MLKNYGGGSWFCHWGGAGFEVRGRPSSCAGPPTKVNCHSTEGRRNWNAIIETDCVSPGSRAMAKTQRFYRFGKQAGSQPSSARDRGVRSFDAAGPRVGKEIGW